MNASYKWMIIRFIHASFNYILYIPQTASTPCAFFFYGGFWPNETFLLRLRSVWCVVVCTSRLYLGMHSVADLVVGLILAFILFLPLVTFGQFYHNIVRVLKRQ